MFFSAALLALPLLAQSAYAATCTRQYTIQEGDICDSISAAKNVSTYQLSAINTGIIDSSCSNLVPGNTICLGYAGEDCSTTYTVVPDDSCDQIAANHGFNTTILALNNPQIDSDCTNLYVGEVLCVAEKVQVPPHPSGALPGATIPVTAAPAKPTSSHVHSAPAATPAPDSDGKDDDDDLPFCDEL